MKTTKKSKTAKNQVVTNKKESTNWNANYYRDKNQAFYTSASYSAPSTPKTESISPVEVATLLAKAAKVRHNPAKPQASISSIVMVGGVPHKMRDGKLVPMIPAKDSKKWDIVEA